MKKIISLIIFVIFLFNVIFLNAKEWEYFISYKKNPSNLPGLLVGSSIFGTLVSDHSKNRWVLTDSALYKYDGIYFNKIEIPDSVNPNNYGASILFDNYDNILLHIGGGDLIIKKSNVWYDLSKLNDTVFHSHIYNIAIDKNNTFWVSFDNYGLFKYDDKGWFFYNKQNSPIIDRSVLIILVDNHNVKWMGSDFGLIKLKDSVWTVFNIINSDLISNYVIPLAIDKNNTIYCEVGFGNFMSYDGNNWRILDMSSIGINQGQLNCVGAVVDSKNNVWFGTDSGLIKFDGSKWKFIGNPPPGVGFIRDGIIQQLSIDSSDNIWMIYPSSINDFVLIVYHEDSLVNVVNKYPPFSDVFEPPDGTDANLQITEENSTSVFNIRYKLEFPGYATYQIYNTLGIMVMEQSLGYSDPGNNSAVFDGSNLSPGMYLFVLQSADKSFVKKFLIVR